MKSWCHDLHISWDIKQNILKLVSLGHFLPFYPLKNLKILILKNIKIFCDIIILHVYQKSQYMCVSWDTGWHRQNFLSFWEIFCPFTKNSQKLWSDDAQFLRHGAWQMNGWTGRWMDGKSNIWRWVPHLKIADTSFKFCKKSMPFIKKFIYFINDCDA